MVERIDFDSKVLEGAPRVNLSRRAIISGIAAGTVFPFVSGCTTNPHTGASQLLLFGDDQVASMAATALCFDFTSLLAIRFVNGLSCGLGIILRSPFTGTFFQF